MQSPTNPILSLVIAALACTPGCSSSGFDELQHTAGAESTGQPEPINGDYSNQFPNAIVAIPDLIDDDDTVMRFVAGGTEPPSLSRFEYDLEGSVTDTSIVITDQLPEETLSFTLAGAADDSGTADGLIVVGGFGTRMELYEVGSGDSPPVHLMTLATEACAGGPYENVGMTMVLTQTDALTGGSNDSAPDLIATAGDSLLLFPNIDARSDQPPSCYVCSLDGVGTPAVSYTINGIAAVDMPRIGEEDQEEIVIALGDPNPTSDSTTRIEIFRADGIQLDNTGKCFATQTSELALNVAGIDLGSGPKGIAVGDFDGNEEDGVAFTIPSQGEVVVLADIGGGSGPSAEEHRVELPDTQTTASFGLQIAAGDVNGNDRDELLIAEHTLEIDGVQRAGSVHVFSLKKLETIPATLESNQLRDLHDSTPEDDQLFGQSLAIAEFSMGADDSVDLAIIGASYELFTYFSVENSDDPRGQ